MGIETKQNTCLPYSLLIFELLSKLIIVSVDGFVSNGALWLKTHLGLLRNNLPFLLCDHALPFIRPHRSVSTPLGSDCSNELVCSCFVTKIHVDGYITRSKR